MTRIPQGHFSGVPELLKGPKIQSFGQIQFLPVWIITRQISSSNLARQGPSKEYARHFRGITSSRQKLPPIHTPQPTSKQSKSKVHQQVRVRKELPLIDFEEDGDFELVLKPNRKEFARWQRDLAFLKTFMSSLESERLDFLVAKNVDPTLVVRLTNSGYEKEEIQQQISEALHKNTLRKDLYKQLMKLSEEFFVWANNCKRIEQKKYKLIFVPLPCSPCQISP